MVERSGQQKELTLTEFFWTDLCSTTTANKAFCAFSRALHWTVSQVPCSRTEICNRFLSFSFDLVFTLVRIVQQGTLNWTCKHVVFVVIFVLSAVTSLKRHIDGLRVKHLHQGCNDLVGFLMTSILLIRTESIQTAQTAVYCRKQCSK